MRFIRGDIGVNKGYGSKSEETWELTRDIGVYDMSVRQECMSYFRGEVGVYEGYRSKGGISEKIQE